MIPAASRPMRLLLCFSLLSLGGVAYAADWADLLRNGNHRELELRGTRSGALGVARELASGERVRVLAALHASAGATDSWALLGDLVERAAGADRSIAIEAAQVAVELSHGLDAFTIEEQEIPSHDLQQWQQAWLKLASSKGRWVDIRIYSLEVAGVLHKLIDVSQGPELSWNKFFEDSDEEMRAAAIQLAPRTDALLKAAAKLATDDPIKLVALSSAQRLCGPIGSVDIPVSDAVDESILARMHALAIDKTLAFSMRVDLAKCLAKSESEESRRAFSVLLQESTQPLRSALVALTQPSAP